MRFDAAQLPGGKVQDEAELLADKVFGLVKQRDAGNDRPHVESGVDGELQQLVGPFHLFGRLHGADADVELREIIIGDRFFQRFQVDLRTARTGFVFFFGIHKLLYQGVDDAVFYLFKEIFGLAELLPRLQQSGIAGVFPFPFGEVHHCPEPAGREGQERLAQDGQVGADLQRDVQDGLHPLRVGLVYFPWLGIGEVLVAEACQVHHFAQGLAETELLQAAADAAGEGLHLFDRGFVGLGEHPGSRHFSFEIFMGEHQGAVDKIA